jgi:hypothetical protein
MIPTMTLPTDQGKQFAETIAGILIDQSQERFNNRLVFLRIQLVVENGSAEGKSLAGRSHAKTVLFTHKGYHFPLFRRL